MTEDFLHFLWKFRLAGENLRSTTGEEIEIINPGGHNTDAGPDFTNARIRIGNTLWAGNVEIHVRSSDWKRHGHQGDDSYDNIILHVVFEDDMEIIRKNGEHIPTLLLKEAFRPETYETYNSFLNNHLWVPCAMRLQEIRPVVMEDWLSALSVGRLERKCHDLEKLLQYNAGDWNQVFFEALSNTFGFRINRQPFEMVARQTPVSCLLKHKDNLFQVEALLFGQAGLLEGRFRGDYPKTLKREYLHLKHKFSLNPVPGHLWKFLRLRPNNFPTIRLAQMAMLIHLHSNLIGEILETGDQEKMAAVFAVGVSDYWMEHYYFDRPSVRMGKTISADTINLVMINNVIPFLFLYGKLKNKPDYTDKALKMMDEIPPESNSITRGFAAFGIKTRSAAGSQALLELKSNFCDQKRCLECRIGLELIT